MRLKKRYDFHLYNIIQQFVNHIEQVVGFVLMTSLDFLVIQQIYTYLVDHSLSAIYLLQWKVV